MDVPRRSSPTVPAGRGRRSAVLPASLALNAALLAVIGLKLRLKGLRVAAQALAERAGLRAAASMDFATIAAERFPSRARGAVTFLGDSQVEHAPLLDMLDLPYRNRGSGTPGSPTSPPGWTRCSPNVRARSW
jgi:hypothetical protein